ncbi:MAG: UDP-N-acetylmuramate--L-alanine ligase [Candidatus Omnitrophota bacterium]
MNKHYHLIGIGGIGMSGIAKLLLRKGASVSGSDLKETRITQELKKLGARIFIGHHPQNIRKAETICYSSAIKEENPEMREARSLGLPVLRRAEVLARLMEGKKVITVAGSHGKTTTASLISALLLEAGLQPCVAVGGILKNIDTNSCLGSGEFFVVEADESDGSFLYYRPDYSIITNIDREHLDYYKEFDRELEAFKAYLDKTQEEGCVFCCDDDAYLKNMLKEYGGRFVLFGLRETAHIYPKNIKRAGLASEFDCFSKGRFIDRFELALGGWHNISNALSVIALGLELKIDLKFIRGALKGFQGAGRRLEIKFCDSNFLLIDDYAHHPTEIKATLEAVKNLGRKRIIVVFQPHRYSRTKLLLSEFGESFDLADTVILTDIYPASELPIPGVNSQCVLERIKQHAPDKDVFLWPTEQVAEDILKILRPGDLVMTLGAGDIAKVSDSLSETLHAGKKENRA